MATPSPLIRACSVETTNIFEKIFDILSNYYVISIVFPVVIIVFTLIAVFCFYPQMMRLREMKRKSGLRKRYAQDILLDELHDI
jgi:hypothetical protein